jgi:L-amino acid N-acyltransferase YncA
MTQPHIRLIRPDDTEPTLEVYKPYVEQTAISFEYEVPSTDEWNKRIASYASEYPWLVCEIDNEIAGYAYSSQHRTRTAYQWSVDSAIYLSEKFHGRGIAKKLYQTLFEILKLQGFVNVFAGITMPNEKSEQLHKRCGFYEIALYKNVGYKFGEWRDVKWLELNFVEHPMQPTTPKKLSEVIHTDALRYILEHANEKLRQ